MKLRFIVVCFFIFNFVSCANLSKNSNEINYEVAGREFKGYLVHPKNAKGKTPAVIVVHEWWGNNEYTRKRADMLAELGYTAFAIDMYGEGKVADHPKDAGAFATEVMKNIPEAKKRFDAAMEILRKDEKVDSDKIAAIGYCFGGGVVLTMARMGEDLKGVASFHGSLKSPVKMKKNTYKGEILVLNGAADPMVKPQDVRDFKNEMNNADHEYDFVNYKGVLHGFTNPKATENGKKFNLPLAYNAAADQDSWLRLRNFLSNIFNK